MSWRLALTGLERALRGLAAYHASAVGLGGDRQARALLAEGEVLLRLVGGERADVARGQVREGDNRASESPPGKERGMRKFSPSMHASPGPGHLPGGLAVALALILWAVPALARTALPTARSSASPALPSTASRTVATLTGRQLLDKAAQATFQASRFERVDTIDQTVVILAGKRRIPRPPVQHVLTIVVDRPDGAASETSGQGGQQITAIKHGQGEAIKIGDKPWTHPTGAYASLFKSLGDLSVCEREVPETQANSPHWRVTGTESIAGHDYETVEGSSVALAQARMTSGIQSAFRGQPNCPTVKVLDYVSQMWIDPATYRRFKTVQHSHYIMTVPRPGETPVRVETWSVATSQYRYGIKPLVIPPEALAIMNEASPSAPPK